VEWEVKSADSGRFKARACPQFLEHAAEFGHNPLCATHPSLVKLGASLRKTRPWRR
jgi:hypothetical protein